MPKARRVPEQYHRLAVLSEELERLLDEHQRMFEEMHRVVAEMRGLGATWAVIGEIMGTSYQTAQKRFGLSPEKRPPRWRRHNHYLKSLCLAKSQLDQRAAELPQIRLLVGNSYAVSEPLERRSRLSHFSQQPPRPSLISTGRPGRTPSTNATPGPKSPGSQV